MRSSPLPLLLLPTLLATGSLTMSPGVVTAQVAEAAPQSRAQLSPQWNDAVQSLAAKIANLVGHAKTISLEVRNISSLTSIDASAIRESLESELTHRQFQLVPPSQTETQVLATLSENVDGYLWVAQLHAESADHIEIVSVPKVNSSLERATTEALHLEKKLIWRQGSRLLDFTIRTAPVGMRSSMLILEPDRLALYTSLDTTSWQLSGSIPIPHSTPWPRDPRGRINTERGYVDLANIRCVGPLESPDQVQCSPKTVLDQARLRPRIPGHQESETALLADRCGEQFVLLSTGNGDWTQPDFVQGYLLADPQLDARPNGDPIPMDGPVMSLLPDSPQNAARAVVHNLKTGNYEAYVITANCSR